MTLPVYVSLTTISSRLDRLQHVLGSLLAQTQPARKIILNISSQGYMLDEGVSIGSLPELVQALAHDGRLIINEVENTGPYRKLVPALDYVAPEECFIATADDDVLYPPEWLETLVRWADRHDCVAAFRCRLMKIGSGGLVPYDEWPVVLAPQPDFGPDGPPKPSFYLFPTERDGAIYKSNYFKDREALAALQAAAPGQDDIAFKFLLMMAGVPVIRAPRIETSMPGLHAFPEIPGNGQTLWSFDRAGTNDIILNKVQSWCLENRGFTAFPFITAQA